MTRKKLSGEVYYPSEAMLAKTQTRHRDTLITEAEENLQAFWEREAMELHWFEPWTAVLDDSRKPFCKWFVGAKTNIVYSCLDRHLDRPHRNKLAVLWERENGDFRSFSYFALHRETVRLANVPKVLVSERGIA